MFLTRCQKSQGELEFSKILTFSIYEGVFGNLKNRLGMIPVRISSLFCVQHKEMGL
ncbi:hypothetical protein E2C01_025690 [Portunus trituberculatus]|uniref:Uncharacterized protein n=1 Tax=Portunus trituberculatus TaxID=210409 RepID=A0A5B7EDL5_PORTR|nr:hypothetical protein [Portunus trituberculatus]